MTLLKKIFAKLKQFKLRFLILVALVVMLMTGVAVYILMRGEKKEETVIHYDTFEIGREQVKSIGDIVGGREWTSMEFTVESDSEKSKYVYEGLTNASEDVEKYAEYLKNECGFVPLMKFDPSNPAGYLSYGKKSIDEGYVLKIDIDYTPEDYIIYTSKSASTEEIPTSDPNEMGGVSRADIVSYLDSFDPSVLELPKSVASYITIFDVGRTVINDVHCYGVNVYEKSEDGKSNLIVGKFYVPVSLDSVYQYNVNTGDFTQIKKIVKEEPIPEEEPVEEEVDTSNMTKEELKEKKKADKAAAKEQAKKEKELEKANKAAQKEQEKKEKASNKAAEKAAKEAEKAAKAEEKAKEAQQKAEEAAAAAATNDDE